jgi:hypothetical protein
MGFVMQSRGSKKGKKEMWGMGNGEWGKKSDFLVPTSHFPLPTPHSLLALLALFALFASRILPFKQVATFHMRRPALYNPASSIGWEES